MNIIPGLLAGLLSALTGFAVKGIVKRADVIPSVFLNNLIIVFLLLPFATPYVIVSSFSWIALLAGLAWIVFDVVLFYSYDKVDASSRQIFIGLQPIFAGLFAVFILGELFTFNLGLSLGLAAIACFLLFKDSDETFISRNGIFLAFLTAVMGALIGSFDKIVSSQFGFVTYTFFAYTFVAVGMFVLSLFLKKNFIKPIKQAWKYILLSALLGAAGFFANLWSYREIGVGISNLFFLTSIPWAITFGYFFAGEKTHMRTKIIASIIIILSVVILSV